MPGRKVLRVGSFVVHDLLNWSLPRLGGAGQLLVLPGGEIWPTHAANDCVYLLRLRGRVLLEHGCFGVHALLYGEIFFWF